jgi:hypothetical protein
MIEKGSKLNNVYAQSSSKGTAARWSGTYANEDSSEWILHETDCIAYMHAAYDGCVGTNQDTRGGKWTVPNYGWVNSDSNDVP